MADDEVSTRVSTRAAPRASRIAYAGKVISSGRARINGASAPAVCLDGWCKSRLRKLARCLWLCCRARSA